MISTLFYMNGYGTYVWSAYFFTLISFIILFYYYYSSLLKKEQELKDLQLKNE
jgi:heme exporter protein CcmD